MVFGQFKLPQSCQRLPQSNVHPERAIRRRLVRERPLSLLKRLDGLGKAVLAEQRASQLDLDRDLAARGWVGVKEFRQRESKAASEQAQRVERGLHLVVLEHADEAFGEIASGQRALRDPTALASLADLLTKRHDVPPQVARSRPPACG